jgi:hypothetical protein
MSDVGEPGARAIFVLELALGRDSPLVGTIRRLESEDRVSFHGWIALMQAIDLLREAAPAPTEDPS